MIRVRAQNSPAVPDVRFTSSGKWVRRVYSTVVLGVLLLALLWVSKPLVFVEGQGQVNAPIVEVSLPHPVVVKYMSVQPSQAVLPGTVLAIVDRPNANDMLRTLNERLHQLQVQLLEFQSRLHAAQTSLSSTRAFAHDAEQRWKKIDQTYRDFVTSSQLSNLQRDQVDAKSRVALLENEVQHLPQEILLTEAEIKSITTEIATVRRTWHHRLVTANEEAVVGPQVREPGASLNAGEALLTLYKSDQAYVMWQLPAFRLVDPQVGQSVSVAYGSHVFEGRVRRVLGLTASSNRSGQSTESNVVEVDLLEATAKALLPIGAPVTVRLFHWK